jgi:hypothetical protein
LRASPLSSLYRLLRGTLRNGGSPRPSAFTGMRERGTRTPVTVTTVGCSSDSVRGRELAAHSARILLRPANSSTALGSSTGGTATRGESGAPPVPAVYDSVEWWDDVSRAYEHLAWDRANREKLS